VIASYLAERGALVADSFVAQRFVLYSACAGSGVDPMSLRRLIRWAKTAHKLLPGLRLARTSRYRDLSHFHGLEAL
jgi:hypothetical protein